MGWHRTHDVDEFLTATGAFLAERPVENTMILTIARNLQAGGPHVYGPDDPIFGWRPGGAFLQTPPFPLQMTRGCPADLADFLADRPLSGVGGVAGEAEAFGARWQELTGATVTVTERNRLYRLDTLAELPAPPGSARVAGPADRDRLIEWFDAFHVEVGHRIPQGSAPLVDDKLSFGGITVWEVGGEVVAFAGNTREAAGAVRVAPVYTPPGQRGRGYAAAVTAAVTRAALDAGAADVVLYTDITNPTSNALYQRLGYRPVEDRTVLEFSS